MINILSQVLSNLTPAIETEFLYTYDSETNMPV